MTPRSKVSRRRVRPRRKINWVPTLLALMLVNVGFACFRSGVTAIRHVNLDGVRKSERLRLERMTESIKGKPALTIDPRVVEGAFMNESRVKSADFRRNIFGVARLILQYRDPVASVVGSKNTYLDGAGVVFFDPEIAVTSHQQTKAMPAIALDPKIRVSAMTLSGVINFQNISDLARLVATELTTVNKTANPIEIQVQEAGGVCLNINNGTVDLGTCEQLAEKIQKLKQVFQEHPDLFEANSSINLMVPENPQVVARKKDNG